MYCSRVMPLLKEGTGGSCIWFSLLINKEIGLINILKLYLVINLLISKSNYVTIHTISILFLALRFIFLLRVEPLAA